MATSDAPSRDPAYQVAASVPSGNSAIDPTCDIGCGDAGLITASSNSGGPAGAIAGEIVNAGREGGRSTHGGAFNPTVRRTRRVRTAGDIISVCCRSRRRTNADILHA